MADDGERPEDDPVLARTLAGARPEPDAVTRAVWFARVAGALFGEAAPVTVGRYQLQRRLGRGGGGSVFVATDPELHRDVAVKLIRYTSERYRERALAEARALAKLSHPNVVPVHDVGATESHVYLVMELLRGAALRDHAVGRPQRELVAAYRQAAAGLAAAHAVGLVHRDFKPDNAMFGDDGRLRVVDFGLAAEAGDAPPSGTPGYMAPEQQAGGHSDARADQYALAVSLREAVGEPPAWLARVLDRATAERPDDRYPDMAALAAALGDDPRTRWRRRAAIAAMIGAPVALAIGFGLGRGATASDTCSGGATTIASAWSPALVAAAVAHVDALGTPFATAAAPLIRDGLLRRGEVWLAAHEQACTAHARGELSGELYDRAVVCLARARLGLGDTLMLVGAAPADRLAGAVGAIADTALAERCADPVALAAEANPQPTPAMRIVEQQIDTAAIHVRAETAEAKRLATGAVAAARRVGDDRLLSRALVELGHALLASETQRAIEPLDEAMHLALAAQLDDVATEAFARRAWAISRARKSDPNPLDGLAIMEEHGKRASEFARALLLNNAGSVAWIAGQFDVARERFRGSWAIGAKVRGPGSVELSTTLSNLATAERDRTTRTRLFAEAHARLVALVGPDHPQTLDKRVTEIIDGTDPTTVLAALRPVCERVDQLHPTLLDRRQACAFERVWQAFALGDLATVRDAGGTDDALRDRSKQRLLVAYRAIADGAAASVVADLDRLAREATARLAGKWYEAIYAGDAELARAAAARAVGDDATRRAAAANAIAHLERMLAESGVPYGSVQRRLAFARELAR